MFTVEERNEILERKMILGQKWMKLMAMQRTLKQNILGRTIHKIMILNLALKKLNKQKPTLK